MNVIKKETPPSYYLIWLDAVCRFYQISANDVLNSTKRSVFVSGCRNIFYTLCLRDGINLYSLSKHLGKARMTIFKSLKEFKLNSSGEVNKILKHLNKHQ